MKLSDNTIKILKNYSQINNKFRFPVGNVISTVNEGGNLFSTVEVPEHFTVEAPFYDLNEFLNVVGLFESPDLEFNDSYVRITENEHSLDYFYGESNLVHENRKGVNVPVFEFSTVIEKDLFSKIIKTSRILKLDHMKIQGYEGIVDIELYDKSGEVRNTYNISTEETTTDQFEFHISVENMTFISDTYTLYVSSKGISYWEGESGIKYYLRIEEESYYNAAADDNINLD